MENNRMKIKNVMKQVYILQDAGNCCANLVVGQKRALLFDTGCGAEDMRSAVESVTKLPLLVVNSHGHFDHIGGNPQFDRTYLAGEDFVIIESYGADQLNSWIKDMAKDVVASHFTEMPKDWSCMQKLDFDTFDLGDLPCTVIPMPGHSAGSVGILIERLGLLLSGDALTPVMCMNFSNHMPLSVQLATLCAAQKLPFTHYLTSHHGCLFEKDMLHRLIHCIEQSKEGRFHRYQYPYPPYARGAMYVDSLEGEPVGLILEEQDCPPGAFRRRSQRTPAGSSSYTG